MGRIFEVRKHTMFARWNRMAKQFARIAKDITMAVKAGGTDPASNPTLRRTIQNARAVNMPKDRIDEYAGQWSVQSVQRVLDSAFAWSVMNSHFDVADFLLAHGADINTSWSSHEPASILHELVFHGNYQAMQFLIDRGIDMTIRDFRWNGTADGRASVAANDEKMAQFLRDAQQRREQASH